MKHALHQLRALLRGHDRGTVAITFMISLPILLFVLSIITQYALIINARITLDHATAATARSAMVALPTDPQIDIVTQGEDSQPFDGAAFVKQAACMQLQSISPPATDSVSDIAQTIADALREATDGGSPIIDNHYAARYTYADAATEVHWQPLDDNNQPMGNLDPPPSVLCRYRSQRVQLIVTYKFYLNAPGAKLFIGELDTVAGVSGRFLKLTSRYNVQLSHGREASSDANGFPQALSPMDSR